MEYLQLLDLFWEAEATELQVTTRLEAETFTLEVRAEQVAMVRELLLSRDIL
jgi:hypothetical protein